MTLKNQLRMTASEIAVGRFMRAPDHVAASGEDEFAAAFKDFGEDKQPAPAATDDKGGMGDGVVVDDAAAAAAAAGGDGGDGAGGDDPAAAAAAAAAAGAGDPPADDKAKPGEPAAEDDKKGLKPAEPNPDDVIDRIAAKLAERGGAPEAKPAETPAAEEPLYSAEEQTKLDAFAKDWPEVAEAFDLRSRALAQSVIKFAFEQIGGVMGPMKAKLDALAGKAFVSELEAATGGYTDEEVDQVNAWVDEQPAYLQKAMKDVISGGTVDEVADLVSRYREAKGINKPAGAGDAPAAEGGDQELSEPAKKAAAALAPVNSQRSTVQAPDDKSNFDAAFGNFAEMLRDS